MEEKKKRIVIRRGDVFCAEIDGQYKMYFQYIIDDLLQLNSRVIRAFQTRYAIDEDPKLEDVVKDKVFFYAHVVIKWGIQMNLWYKVGNVKFDDSVNVLLESVLITEPKRRWRFPTGGTYGISAIPRSLT